MNGTDPKKSHRSRRVAIDSADSDFSGDEDAYKASKRKNKKSSYNENKQESDEDTFEEEDPFSPEVDLILADRVVEDPVAPGCKITNRFKFLSSLFSFRTWRKQLGEDWLNYSILAFNDLSEDAQ